MNVYQHLDELKDSDGVGNDAIGLHNQFISLGWKSNFITRISRKGMNIPNTHFHSTNDSIKFKTSDLHILHYGGHGYPISIFQNAPGKKVLRFHNITPSSYYLNSTTSEIHAAMNRFESLSYLEIASLSIGCDTAWCDSPYNSHTIQSFNFRSLNVLPICKSYKITEMSEAAKNSFNICFVGRYAPQKKWEDLIYFFSHWLKKHPQARLFCIGSIIGAFDGYFSRLQNLITELDLHEHVHFLTGLSDQDVIQKMQESGAFVSMSEHEGFCLPLLEAYGAGLPVFAYDAGATKSTMKDAGIIFTEKKYPELVDALDQVLLNHETKSRMISKQFASLNYYNQFPWKKVLSSLVNKI